jgi:hypothetical protein
MRQGVELGLPYCKGVGFLLPGCLPACSEAQEIPYIPETAGICTSPQDVLVADLVILVLAHDMRPCRFPAHLLLRLLSCRRVDIDLSALCIQERPCTRCIKRNIGHLCHDEPRDSDSKKSKSLAPSTIQDTASQPDKSQPGAGASGGRTMRPPSFDAAAMNNGSQAARSAFEVLAAARGGNATNPLQLVQPTPVSGMAAASALSGLSQCKWLDCFLPLSVSSLRGSALPYSGPPVVMCAVYFCFTIKAYSLYVSKRRNQLIPPFSHSSWFL